MHIYLCPPRCTTSTENEAPSCSCTGCVRKIWLALQCIAVRCSALQSSAGLNDVIEEMFGHMHKVQVGQHTAIIGKLQQIATRSNTYSSTGDATHCKALQHTATYCNALQHTATHCNALHCTALHCNALQHNTTHCNALQRTATHCNALQHCATHCNALQSTASHCNALTSTAAQLRHTAMHLQTHHNGVTVCRCRLFSPNCPVPENVFWRI